MLDISFYTARTYASVTIKISIDVCSSHFSSQKCSCCGFRMGKLDLSIREWVCLNCGTSHDRDVNTPMNVLVAGGHLETLNGRGGQRQTTVICSSDQRSVNPPEFQQLSIFELLE